MQIGKKTDLLSLPTELLQLIYDELRWMTDDSHDIESFVFCSKMIHHKLAMKLRKHFRLKRKYTNIVLTEAVRSPDPEFRPFHTAALLRDILLDKSKAVYPQKIIIEGSPINSDVDNSDDEETEGPVMVDAKKYLEGLWDELTAQLSECQLFTPEEINMYKGLIREQGLKEAAVVVLVCLLPNLKSMSLAGSFATGTTFCPFLDRMFLPIESLVISGLPPDSIIQDPRPRAPVPSALSQTVLNKILEVDLTCGERYRIWRDGFYLFECFAYLPNIRSLRGRRLISTYHFELFPCNTLKVQTMTFRDSMLPVQSLVEMARGAKALKEFTYEHSALPVRTNAEPEHWELDGIYDTDFRPAGIVTGLRQHLASSLTRLDLTGECIYLVDNGHDGCAIGSLREFSVLAHIRVNGVMFFKLKKSGKVYYIWKNGFEEHVSEDDYVSEDSSDDSPIHPTESFSLSKDEDPDNPKHFIYDVERMEMQRLVDVLPQSVQTFTSTGIMTNTIATLMLQGLAELKEERVPDLELIMFENKLSLGYHEVADVSIAWNEDSEDEDSSSYEISSLSL